MKVVEINSTVKGSTGNIMINIANMVRKQGDIAYTFSRIKHECTLEGHNYFGSIKENLEHRLISVLSGISGKGSSKGTKVLLKEIERVNPDILHLHNLHGWYINLPMLFDFIKDNKIKTIWTLHDCWGFTAQCSHFTIEKCYKWQTGCFSCPRYRLYPYTYIDRTKKMWILKKEWFTGVENMTIITPSQWLANLVKQSFLKDYPVQVINNGIDLEIFKPTKSNFREKYYCEDRIVLLGVAMGWGKRKGLDVFIELSKRLDNRFQIVLVGTDDKVDQELPDNIISIHYTSSQRELAEIYSAADIFINPTREENFPTVNIESLACGTPIITFKTGGSAEIIDGTCGVVVEQNDIESLEIKIISVSTKTPLSEKACIKRSKLFDMNNKFMEYFELYNIISNTGGNVI